MRILIISQVWEPESGTPQRRWRWLVSHLRSKGHKVSVIVPPPHYPAGKLLSHEPEYQSGARATGPSGEVVYRCHFAEHDFSLASRIKDQATMALSQLHMALGIIRAEKPDVILATAPPLPAVFTAAAVSSISRAPLVVDLRDAWPDLLNNMGAWDPRTHPGRHKALKEMLMPWVMQAGGTLFNLCLRQAAGVITTSEAFTLRHKSKGKSHVLTVRNFGARRNTRISTPPPSGITFNVLYAGTVGRAQGLLNALKAVQIALKSGIDIRLRIVGDGVDVAPLKRFVNLHGLPVEFLDSIPFQEIPKHYEWAHTVLVHLRGWEPFQYTVPSKLYEALELGRHISLVAQGEAEDIVRATASGDCVPPEDPQALADLWQKLASNRELLNISNAGHIWLNEHGDPQQNGESFVSFIQEVVRATQTH